MDRLVEWCVKALVVVLIAPIVICAILQGLAAALVVILPWVLGGAAVILLGAVVAALVTGFVRHPYALREREYLPGEPIRRPRGLRERDR